MRHAGSEALDLLEDLLALVRTLPAARERTRGVFYRGSVASLHFHEDPQGVFADVRLSGTWRRLRVSTAPEKRALWLRLRADWVPEAPRRPGGREKRAEGGKEPSRDRLPSPASRRRGSRQ